MKAHKGERDTNFIFLSIVSIVAIVGIIVMITNSGSSSSADLAGEAFRSKVADINKVIEAENQSAYCYDTDKGINYYVRGTVYYSLNGTGNYSMTDYCRNYNSTTLVEFYCDGAQWRSLDYKCLSGCGNGVCLNSTNSTINISKSR